VLAVSRDGLDKSRTLGRADRPFVLRVQDSAGAVTELQARAVIDASGTWEQRNPLGSSGLPALGEEQAQPFLVGPLPDVLGQHRARFAGTYVPRSWQESYLEQARGQDVRRHRNRLSSRSRGGMRSRRPTTSAVVPI